MKKRKMHIILGIFSILWIVFPVGEISAQQRSNNPLYGPPEKYQPVALVKRLSYENFRNIKLLSAAILNFGGGESEVDRLVDQYAEASALYFQNKYEESAKLFEENEKEIFATAKKLVGQYYEFSDKLLKQSIKMNIKKDLDKSLKDEKTNPYGVHYLNNARFAVQKGNDIYDRFRNATTASPRELVEALYYFRRAKENMFNLHDIYLEGKERDDFFTRYERDIEDNKNKVYQSKEKQN